MRAGSPVHPNDVHLEKRTTPVVKRSASPAEGHSQPTGEPDVGQTNDVVRVKVRKKNSRDGTH